MPGKCYATLWRPAATSVRSVGAFAGSRLPISGNLRRSYSSSVCHPRKKHAKLLPSHGTARSPPADLAYGSVDLAALESRARRGAIIVLYEDETILWRFALPRLGWWRRAQRYRLPTRPLSHTQIKRAEALKRQAWLQYRAWSRITSGVFLSVIGAVQYGTSKVFYTIVPHFAAQELRPYLHPGMATFSNTDKEVVMVVDRRGLHRAHKLDATLEPYHNKLRFHCFPAHCGHHLNPIEGFWRVLQDTIGAGRCFADLPLFYQRTRQVLMAHHERPIYEFHW